MWNKFGNQIFCSLEYPAARMEMWRERKIVCEHYEEKKIGWERRKETGEGKTEE